MKIKSAVHKSKSRIQLNKKHAATTLKQTNKHKEIWKRFDRLQNQKED